MNIIVTYIRFSGDMVILVNDTETLQSIINQSWKRCKGIWDATKVTKINYTKDVKLLQRKGSVTDRRE